MGRVTTGSPTSSIMLLASQMERILPATVLVVAVFLRLYSLDTIPTGLLTDEAFNGLDALRILDGERPIFLADNNGREALFVYFQAISIAFLGQSALALRVVSAILGILTVVIAYFLAKRMFGPRVALLASCWVTLSLYHLIFSRTAWRTIALPLFLAIGFYCLWRGLHAAKSQARTRHVPALLSLRPAIWFALGGISIGLSLYTYSTARFAPLVIVMLALYLAILHRDLFRTALPGFILALGLTTLVFLPQGLFFLSHPESFVERAREVTIFNPDLQDGNPSQALIDSALRTLGMFAIKGDAVVDKNIPGRPLLDPLSALFMLMGIALALRRFRHPAYGFLIIWLAVMFAPSFAAVSGTPNYLRITGMIPALFILPALGAVWLWEAWESRTSFRQYGATRVLSALPIFLVTLAFVGGTFHTFDSYFRLWARLPELARSFNADSYVALDAARTMVRTEQEPVFLAGGEYQEHLVSPGVRFILANQSDARLIRIFDPDRSFIFPDEQAGANYVFADDPPPASIKDTYFDGASARSIGTSPSGRPITLLQLLNARPPFEPELPTPARFGDQLFVNGFDLPNDVQAGETMTVRWYWRVLATDQRELAFSNQLFDEGGRRRVHVDQPGFIPGRWPVGVTGFTAFQIDVNAATPTGAYWLRVALYDLGQQDLLGLPVFDAQGNQAGNDLRLGPIKVHGRPPAPSTEGLLPSPLVPDNLLPATFADQIDLLGYDLEDRVLTPGASFELKLYWTPRGRPTQDYTVFVHLLDSEGQLRSQADSPPTSGKYPTSVWDAGEVIADFHALSLAPDLPAGEYTVAIGLYDPQTGQRLPIIDQNGKVTGDLVIISGLVVGGE